MPQNSREYALPYLQVLLFRSYNSQETTRFLFPLVLRHEIAQENETDCSERFTGLNLFSKENERKVDANGT